MQQCALWVPAGESIRAVEGGNRDHDANAYRKGGHTNHHQIGRDDANEGECPDRGDNEIYSRELRRLPSFRRHSFTRVLEGEGLPNGDGYENDQEKSNVHPKPYAQNGQVR
jgi:hypothetical protein